MLKFFCNRFARLLFERNDRSLTASEEMFFNAHLAKCETCWQKARTEESAMLDLRSLTENPEPSEEFTDRILLSFREGPKPISLGYWSPALIGAAIAGIAVLSALTVVTRTADSPIRRTNAGEARRVVNPLTNDTYPDLNLDSPSSREQ